ncbi:uncharacterized protein T551_02436 [Pneumocystis jirovecii RU7]|uniref:Major surface glycoprotein 2 C-terminal domain-containing protein n=1 Tax=Pneumocystis jirovecii (strain RU7) TaxID=1408657 RepID=A0A0W4ZGW2_PNEJ7|nr:uncharacterized protein T551_03107 [Pneumocystis jirovecii RU7]XP_018228921.1 uncharacterized protein T551_02436 [Pneumocystis jirovecii RU7]KTW27608.1 hypothetical protein T551_03107 [Pneumocystis jirovecii RU7]KTW28586.1 hypothetical protein T551_02436 [Pneumocystis jirovecii RU7]
MARAVARAVKRQAKAAQKASVYEEEDYLLALILKEDSKNEQKCKEELEKYCKALKDSNLNKEEIHEKLKDLCKNDAPERTCKELKTKVQNKCNKLVTKLDGILKKPNSGLTDGDCKENEQECLFLEGACPSDLTENCNKLRNLCYQRKRDKVAKEVLLRAHRSNLNETDICKKKLKEVCPELERESDELMELCLNQKKTCNDLVAEGKNKCDALKKDVQGVLDEKNKLEEKCLLLLKQCYFYVANCEEKDMIKCIELEEKCYEKNIVYIPPGPDFDPTKPEPPIIEEIGLEELYKEAGEEGVLIEKPITADTTSLLSLLTENVNKGKIKEKCDELLERKCKDPEKHNIFEDLCGKGKANENGTQKCEELEKDIEKICKILTPTILKNRLFDKTNKHSGIIGWGELPTFLSDEDCARLESYCFYYKERCPDGKQSCMNVRAACYKRGLDARANKVLQKNMHGLLRGSNQSWLKEFQRKLIKVCKKLKEENKGSFSNDELFILCVQPAKAARLLTHDHQMRTVFLRKQLDQKRDFPTDKDCKELGRKCQDLGKDSKEITWPCHTLEQQCNRLGTTEILKQVLLDEHKDTLKDQKSCVKYLKEKCNKWSRRGDDRFSLVCVFLESTCKLMVEDVQNRCKVFKENTQASNITDVFEDNTRIESLASFCPFWSSYCHRFGPNCPDLKKEATFCTKLEKHCEPFYKRKALEDALKVELRGKLGGQDKCESALEKYCTVAGNVNNASIRSLCKDNAESKTKKADDKDIRKNLCLKLVEEVKEQCKTLPEELKQLEKDLEDDFKVFKELKEQAKEAMNKSNLVLSFVKKDENNASKNSSKNKDKNTVSNGLQDTTEPVKILRRGVKDVSVTELEAKAFDLVAEVFGRYVDLKERCNKLESDCGIKEDCKDLEGVCGKIQGVCSKLKPLKVKSHEIVTESTTTTTTTTTTVTDPKATECKSLQTTDTWVTQTSTHTSTSTITSTITSKITLTSTRRCKPTKCTTGDDAEDVKPSEGLKMSGWSVMRGVILAMMISFMI